MNISRFEEFAPTIKALPDTFALEQPLPKALHLEAEGGLSVFYAPFDHLNEDAKIVLVGITPGRVQAIEALTRARELLRRGASYAEASAQAKNAASFAGPMRSNLIAMLDHIGVAPRLGLQTTAQLWSTHTSLVHFTSALRYPVFDSQKNYSGAGLIKQRLLRSQVDRCFVPECRTLSKALFVPLGPAALSACDYACSTGALRASQVLRGMAHPSGANAERIAYFLGRKSRATLSDKTRPDAIDDGRSLAMRSVERWAQHGSEPSTTSPLTPSADKQRIPLMSNPQKLATCETPSVASHTANLPKASATASSGAFTGERAKSVLDEMVVPLRDPTKKIAAYRTRNGLQLAVERTTRTPLLWLEKLPPGMRLQVVNPNSPGLPYASNQPRHSNLKQQAPNLATGERAYKVAVPDRASLVDLVNAYAALSRATS